MKLKEMREKAGLSQSRLAYMTGVKVRTIQHYEQGTNDINGAKLKTLLLICDAIGCRLKDILTDEEVLQLLDKLNID